MPTPALPNVPSAADWNADRLSHMVIVGSAAIGSPIRSGHSVDRVACSDGFELSCTVIGYPVCAVTAKLASQPPTSQSSGLLIVVP